MTEKEFNDIVERLSRAWRKSFAETLRDLCNGTGIEFKLNLRTEEKKEIMKKILELEESKDIIPDEKRDEIIKWIQSGRRKRA